MSYPRELRLYGVLRSSDSPSPTSMNALGSDRQPSGIDLKFSEYPPDAPYLTAWPGPIGTGHPLRSSPGLLLLGGKPSTSFFLLFSISFRFERFREHLRERFREHPPLECHQVRRLRPRWSERRWELIGRRRAHQANDVNRGQRTMTYTEKRSWTRLNDEMEESKVSKARTIRCFRDRWDNQPTDLASRSCFVYDSLCPTFA